MDRYSEREVVGRGGFGEAVRCTRNSDGKVCIIKKVNIATLSQEDRKEAKKEAALLNDLSHPNIVGFWESFLHGPSRDVLCIVMDYADGGDLGKRIEQARQAGRPFNEDRILIWFVQMSLALEYIHGKNILHRDLKPGNIFLTSSGVIKLGDFGIAKVLDGTRAMAHTIIGTIAYMAPEVLNRRPYNHKADMWSLGCVLYEMASLRLPFERQQEIFLANPRRVPTRYSKRLRDLVKELLQREPLARPSVGAVLQRPLIRASLVNHPPPPSVARELGDNGAVRVKISHNVQRISSTRYRVNFTVKQLSGSPVGPDVTIDLHETFDRATDNPMERSAATKWWFQMTVWGSFPVVVHVRSAGNRYDLRYDWDLQRTRGNKSFTL